MVVPGSRKPGGSICTDLVLEREELRMLQIFHRSFNLPGIRLGLVNPVCTDDYFPAEEVPHERGPLETLPAQLESVLPRRADCKQTEDAAQPSEEIEIAEEICDTPSPDELCSQQPASVGSRPHSRTIRNRPPL
ncbi:MAG: hypothetical protein SGPRY_013878, partial [Prymnesium sp.]